MNNVKKLLGYLLLILGTLWIIYFVGKSTYLFVKYGMNDDIDSSIPKQVEIFDLTIPESSLIYFEHIENIENPRETLVYYSGDNRCVVYNNFLDKEDKEQKYQYYYISDEDKDKLIQLINNTINSNYDNSLLNEETYYANQYINKDVAKKFTPFNISRFNFKKLS